MDGLKLAGLTGNEEKIYLALLDLGPSLAGQIARKSGLHRRTVYDVTEMLIKKGLIGYILKNNRRIFSASDPKRIIELVREKENSLIPVVDSLKEKYNSKKNKEETLFYKGHKALKAVFESQLDEKEILILGAYESASDVLKYYFNWYDKKRIRRKIDTRVITVSRNLSRIKKAKIRYLPKKYASPVAINIYGDKTAIIHWSKEPKVIVINDKEITKGYRKYFELMWGVARE